MKTLKFVVNLFVSCLLFTLSPLFLCAQDEPTSLPCQVSNVKVDVHTTYVILSWDLPDAYDRSLATLTDALGDTIDYTWYFLGDSIGFYLLDANTPYQYNIAAQCVSSDTVVVGEPVIGEFTTSPCGKVSNVKAVADATTVDMSWDTPPVIEFLKAQVVLADLSGDTITYQPHRQTDLLYKGLESVTSYRYMITLVCDNTGRPSSIGETVTGEFSTLPCGQVSNVQANARMTDVNITWEGAEDHACLAALTNIAGNTIGEVPYTHNEVSFSGLETSTTYSYRITLRCTENSAGEPVTGEFSTLPCGQVSNVQANAGIRDVNITWEGSEDHPCHVALTNIAGDTIGVSFDAYNFFSCSGIKPNTTYSYSITLRCTENSSGEPITGEVTTLPVPQVSNVQVIAGITDVKLSWDAPDASIASYNVSLSQNRPNIGGSNLPIVSKDVNDTYFSYSGLQPNTEYLYGIAVTDSSGNSGNAVKGSFKTLNNTDIENGESRLSVRVYPNPNTGEAVIEIGEVARMEILSPAGILREAKNLNAGKHTLRFTSKGVFMIRLSNTNGTTVKRIVVL
ncbi:MAG: T9SS type A sorting domain-containing protein [Bacteroides sp.]|nr:T9SS type A sorting domain-containing protein [Bacteroides sp.]MCM1086508.1 T9SS type A sorting domain-containing protein [Bacteroides sp.]